MGVRKEQHPEWGEMKVEDGTGTVERVEHQEGKRNAHVSIRASHLRQPVTAWCDTEGDLFAVVLGAYDRVETITYRVEVHRKREIDRSIPFDELGNDMKVRDLAGLEVGGNGTYLAPTPRPAPAKGPAPASGRQSAENGRSGGAGSAPPPAGETGDRPWHLLHPDGTVNLGSYAAGGVAALVTRAYAILADAPITCTPAGVEHLARALLGVADNAASQVNGGTLDRMSGTHTRSRHMLLAVLEDSAPPLQDGDAAAFAEWLAKTERTVTLLLGITARLTMPTDTQQDKQGGR